MHGGTLGVAFITGAASGIGRAAAIRYAKAGISRVCLVDLSTSKKALEDVATQCRRVSPNKSFQPLILTADVTVENQITAAVEEAYGQFNRIDYAVNSAGIVPKYPKLLSENNIEDFDLVSEVNTRGLFLSLRAELSKMKSQEPYNIRDGRSRERGAIVNLASAASVVALQGLSVYGASKHAVVGLTKAAATDHATHGIRVNSVSPGYIDTPMNEDFLKDPGARTAMMEGSLLKRLGEADEVADAIIFLNSGRASFITGHNLVVDGGYSIV